ncbi:BrxA family protein [Aquirufa sp. ROCK2-A2]
MGRNSNNYDANFTAGGLLLSEFIALESILLGNDFELNIQEEQEQNKIIGIATLSARKRIISEIKRRNSCAPAGFWDHFFSWNQNEMKFGLLFLCFKTYPLILDIHIEVAFKKFKTGNNMNAYDIQMRLDEIASSNEIVSKWSESTLEKLNVQYRKAIKDTGLYDGSHLIRPVTISHSFWSYFSSINEEWFLNACFINI